MNNSQYITLLKSIIEDKTFVKKLKVQVQNFPNLKLENHIRNILVELTNIELNNSSERVFAEHPRFRNNGKSINIDFSICQLKNDLFKMELKYFFTDDLLRFKQLSKVIENDFINRGRQFDTTIDGFLLIVCDNNKQAQNDFEKKYTLNKLSQYQTKTNEDWNNNIEIVMNELVVKHDFGYENTQQITFDLDFQSSHHFYFLYRK